MTVIGQTTASRMAELFSALSDPTRLRLLSMIDRKGESVQALTRAVGLTQSAVSHQLKTLRDLRLVEAGRVGKRVVYRLTDDAIRDLFRRGLDHARRRR